MLRYLKAFLPLLVFVLVVVFFWKGLGHNPRLLQTALLNKPAPNFTLGTLEQPKTEFTKHDLLGKVSLVHVWATWCVTCMAEHPVIVDLSHKYKLPIYAIDYKDNKARAKAWLKRYGDPYQKVGFDKLGNVAINWGVYGTPETFIVDKQGIIRYRQVGAIDQHVWQSKLWPEIQKLKAEKVS